MKKRPPSYLDAWLIAFLLLMCAASVIAAHGAYTFFRYLLDPPIAALATAVVASGIPALDAAGTLEGRRSKAALYWSGALVFLAMETLANYFSGQAVFLTNVLQAFAGKDGADLVWLARQPAGRVLVVVYLAMPSLIVAYFAYAAASRWRAIRDARAIFASRSRRSGQIRALVVRLTRAVRELRKALAIAQQTVRELLDQCASHSREVGDLHEQNKKLQQQITEAQRAVRETNAEIEHLRSQSRDLALWPANEPPTRARVVTYVREQMAAGRSRLDVARELGFADGTLRSWMESSNGVEALN